MVSMRLPPGADLYPGDLEAMINDLVSRINRFDPGLRARPGGRIWLIIDSPPDATSADIGRYLRTGFPGEIDIAAEPEASEATCEN